MFFFVISSFTTFFLYKLRYNANISNEIIIIVEHHDYIKKGRAWLIKQGHWRHVEKQNKP